MTEAETDATIQETFHVVAFDGEECATRAVGDV